MNKPYKRWVCGLLAALLLALLACGGFVYAVDPFCYYRLPTAFQPVFFNERCQAAGLAKNTPADTVLLGTSMVANYRASQAEAAFGGTAVKLTLPDGYLSEFDDALQLAFRHQAPRRVVFGLDANILIRDESEKTDAMPDYLYNESRLDDGQYLWNKDALFYSAYVLLQNVQGDVAPADEAFTWDADQWWNHMTAMRNYQRPEPAADELPADSYLAAAEENLAVVTGWAAAHPEVEFDVFLPPYSILYWDKTARLGQTEAVFAALDLACRELTRHENVKLYGFLFDREIVDDLDNYCDYVHHSGAVCAAVLEKMTADQCRLEAENYHETLANWQDFVVHYDYEKFWDTAFWEAWNAEHPAS